MNIAEIRAGLEKAKKQRREQEAERVAERLTDLEAHMVMECKREESAACEFKRAKDMLADLNKTRNDLDEYKDSLAEYDEMVASIEAEIKTELAKVRQCEDDLKKLQVDKARNEGLADQMRDELAKLGRPAKVSCKPTTHKNRNGLFIGNTSEMVPSCLPVVQKIFKDICALPGRLQPWSHDQGAKYFIIKDVASRARMEGEKLDMNDEVSATVMRRCMGVLRSISKEHEAGYINALDHRKSMEWVAESRDATRQLRAYFSNVKSTLGVPEATISARLSRLDNNVEPLSNKTKKKTNAKTKIKTKKAKKAKIILDKTLINETEGMRAAILGGEAHKNDDKTTWIGNTFRFKEVRYYDKQNNDLLTRIRNGHIDVLFVFTRWHSGYMPYVKAAESAGTKVVLLNNSNKQIICDTAKEVFLRSCV